MSSLCFQLHARIVAPAPLVRAVAAVHASIVWALACRALNGRHAGALAGAFAAAVYVAPAAYETWLTSFLRRAAERKAAAVTAAPPPVPMSAPVPSKRAAGLTETAEAATPTATPTSTAQQLCSKGLLPASTALAEARGTAGSSMTVDSEAELCAPTTGAAAAAAAAGAPGQQGPSGGPPQTRRTSLASPAATAATATETSVKALTADHTSHTAHASASPAAKDLATSGTAGPMCALPAAAEQYCFYVSPLPSAMGTVRTLDPARTPGPPLTC